MPGFKVLYKIFCVSCDWFVQRNTDAEIWKKLARCPDCSGPTDAFKE